MTDNPVFKHIMDTQVPKELPDIDGYMWVNILIKYNTRTGKSSIERSFTKPAEMSKIKHLVKKKKKKEKVTMESVDTGKELF